MPDLILTNMDGLVGNMKVKGSCSYCDHEMVHFCIQRTVRMEHSKLISLDLLRADFDLFRGLLGRMPCNKALKGRGAQESWLILKDHLCKTQE